MVVQAFFDSPRICNTLAGKHLKGGVSCGVRMIVGARDALMEALI